MPSLPCLPLGPFQRLADRAVDDVSGGLAEVVRAIPDGAIDGVMRTPARGPVLDAVFWLLPRYLERTRATALNIDVRCRITGADGQAAEVYDLSIRNRRCRVLRGGRGRPPLVTITVDGTELVHLATGRSNPMQAYFSGRLSLRGDIMQAIRLTALFRTPAPATT